MHKNWYKQTTFYHNISYYMVCMSSLCNNFVCIYSPMMEPCQNMAFLFFIYFFYVHVSVHRNKFLCKKRTRCTKFTNLFCHETLHVMVYVIQVCRQLILVLLQRCLQTCMTYTIAECTVNKLWMMDR
jgi:hypothetical protein